MNPLLRLISPFKFVDAFGVESDSKRRPKPKFYYWANRKLDTVIRSATPCGNALGEGSSPTDAARSPDLVVHSGQNAGNPASAEGRSAASAGVKLTSAENAGFSVHLELESQVR
jgi:hypothetical protein